MNTKKILLCLVFLILTSLVSACNRQGTQIIKSATTSSTTETSTTFTTESSVLSTEATTITTTETTVANTTTKYIRKVISKDELIRFYQKNKKLVTDIQTSLFNMDTGIGTVEINWDGSEPEIWSFPSGSVVLRNEVKETLRQYLRVVRKLYGYDYDPIIWITMEGSNKKIVFEFEALDSEARFAYSTAPIDGMEPIGDENWYVTSNPY